MAAVQATWRAHAVRRSLKCSCSATEMQNGSTVWQCTEMSIAFLWLCKYMYIRCLKCKEPVAISLYILDFLFLCNLFNVQQHERHNLTIAWSFWWHPPLQHDNLMFMRQTHTQYTHTQIQKEHKKSAHLWEDCWNLLVRGNFKWVSLFCRSKNGDAFSTGCHLHSALLAYAHAHWMKSHQRS